MSKKWCKNAGRATCSPYASDNAACKQRPDRAPVESTITKVSITLREEYKAGHNERGSTTRAPQEICSDVRAENKAGNNDSGSRRRRLLKIVGASGLAIMMGASVLCGVLISPANTNANIANQPENAVVSNEDLAAEIKSYKEDIAAGKIKYAPSALGLDPENDPVLWTTETGLEIKQSNAISNPNISKYLYVTMGTYSGYAINWLICGFPKVIGETTTPAGAAINAEISKNYYHTSPIAGTTGLYCDTSLAANNFRLVSECTLGNSIGTLVSNSQGANYTVLRSSDYDDDLYWQDTKNLTLSNYKTNNTLALNTYVNNGTITTNIYYLSQAQANLLLNRIAYAIGTTTATAWWESSSHSSSQTSSDEYYKYYSLTLPYYNTSGSLTSGTTSKYKKYDWDDGDDTYYANGNTNLSCGIRPGIVAKLL